MKKRIFSLMIGAVVALASCSKSEEAPIVPQSGEQTATFTIAAPATRGVADLSRYIVEAYEDNDFTATPQRVEAATGELTLTLKKNTVYTFVFWADNGTANTAVATSNDYYDATSLQDVKVTPSAYATVATPAYALAVSFNSKDFETKKSVTLKNATAQINFVEGAGLLTADNSLMVKYSSGGKLNVATGVITEIGAEISRTYPNIEATAQDGILATDYILAPLGEKRLLNLKVSFNTEAEKTISAVPFQQSYKTNIKGEFSNFYSSEFTISNEVEDYTDSEDVFFPAYKVGDPYPNAISPIGIVFSLDETHHSYNATTKTSAKGKIVSLDEVTGTTWGPTVLVNGQSTSYGRDNMKALKALGDDFSQYPAAKWCNSKNLTNVDYLSDEIDIWYLPAKDELERLHSVYFGVDGYVQDQIDALGAKEKFNAILLKANGTPLAIGYSSSSEYQNGTHAHWYTSFNVSKTYTKNKAELTNARCIREFSIPQ